MKKSKYIKLVLVATALSSCADNNKATEQKVYMRSDTTATYSQTQPYAGFYAFRPYGFFLGGMYNRTGYYSSAISERSNIGSNPVKSSTVRGGFGRSAYRTSS